MGSLLSTLLVLLLEKCSVHVPVSLREANSSVLSFYNTRRQHCPYWKAPTLRMCLQKAALKHPYYTRARTETLVYRPVAIQLLHAIFFAIIGAPIEKKADRGKQKTANSSGVEDKHLFASPSRTFPLPPGRQTFMRTHLGPFCPAPKSRTRQPPVSLSHSLCIQPCVAVSR